MKKIMIIGADEKCRQVIEVANKSNYLTYGCSLKEDNPVSDILHKYYKVDASDVEKVSKIIEEEKIDAVISYSSDFLAVIQAKIAEKTGLTGNSVECVETLVDKNKFKKFLRENGFNDTFIAIYNDKNFDINDKKLTKYPMIVKPNDSAGSQGVTRVDKKEDLLKAYEYALSFSPSKNVIVEKFIESKHKYFIEGDIFVNKNEVIFFGIDGELRDLDINPYLPMGTFTPNFLTESELLLVKTSLQNIVKKIDFNFGGMNIEIIIDKNDDLYFIELAPRNGGNYISDQLDYAYGVDLKKLLIDGSLNVEISAVENKCNKITAIYVVHSYKNGVLKAINIDKSIENKIVTKWGFKKQGDKVQYFENAKNEIGMFLAEFNTKKELEFFLENHNELVKVEVE